MITCLGVSVISTFKPGFPEPGFTSSKNPESLWLSTSLRSSTLQSENPPDAMETASYLASSSLSRSLLNNISFVDSIRSSWSLSSARVLFGLRTTTIESFPSDLLLLLWLLLVLVMVELIKLRFDERLYLDSAALFGLFEATTDFLCMTASCLSCQDNELAGRTSFRQSGGR